MATQRRTLIENIKTTFEAAAPASGVKWKKVFKTRAEGRAFEGKNVMQILSGPETYIDVVSPDKRDRVLEVELASRTYVSTGTDLTDYACEVLADMEDIVEANERWGGVAYSTTLVSNLVEIEATGDRVVEITLFIQVRYRTRRSDPRA